MTIEETKEHNRKVAIKKILEAGRSITPNFTLNEEQEEYYLDLMAYFLGKPRRFDLNKGLLILGTIGTGKTMSFEVMRKLYGGFQIVNTRYVVRDYITTNPSALVIDKYGRNSFGTTPAGVIDYKKPKIFCFDDFGLESIDTRSFGNAVNVMEEIMGDRYDYFLKHGLLTFATSNLKVEQIEECYGPRVRDRIRQIMNVHVLVGDSLRK